MNIQVLLAGLVLLLASNVGSFFYGKSVGSDLTEGKQAKVEIVRADKTIAAVVKNTGEIISGVKQDNNIERKANESYDKAVVELNKARADNRKLIAANGGLRISADACAGSHSDTGEAQATSSSIGNEYTAGTIALPQSIESDLQDSADEADIILEKLRVLQQWVFDQGFYGPGEVNSSVPEATPIH